MIEELVRKYVEQHRLAPSEEAQVLRQGTYCHRAEWVTHPVDATWRVIRCKLWGDDARIWLTPKDDICDGCKYSPAYAGGDERAEESRLMALRLAAQVRGEDIEAALDAKLAEWHLDTTKQETKDALATIIAAKNIPRGLDIAKRRGYVE